jgi:hypothetical protein
VNVPSQEIDEANTIHPNDGWNVQRKNGNKNFILIYTLCKFSF